MESKYIDKETSIFDTIDIRLRFRRLLRHSVWVVATIFAVYACFFSYLGDPIWKQFAFLLLLSPILYFLGGERQSLLVFMVSTFILLTLTVWSFSYLSLEYGKGGAFHYLLICLVPVIMFGGRLHILRKWFLIACLLSFGLMVDHLSSTASPRTLPEAAIETIRFFNLSVIFLVVGYMAQLHFVSNAISHSLLRSQANTDPLTGLLNRRRMHEVLLEEAALVARYNHTISVIFMDIDHFKRFNDSHGHEVGDAVLKHVSHIIKDEIRLGDHASRWGGEEFLILLPRTDSENTFNLAERLRIRIEQMPLRYKDKEYYVTSTFGTAIMMLGQRIDDVIRQADMALYAAKLSGRNQVMSAPLDTPVTYLKSQNE